MSGDLHRAVACTTEKGTSGQKVDSIRKHQSKPLISAGKHREKPDTTMDVVSESVVVENNLMSAKPIIKGLEKGYESCMKNATCRNGLMQLGVNFGLTAAQIQEAMDAGIATRNGDTEAMR